MSSRGFSLVEVLVVIGIFLVLGAVVLPVAGNFYTSSSLEQESNNLVTALRSAHTRSLARFNNSAHGVFLEPAVVPPRYTLYQGVNYAGRQTAYDVVTILPPSFTLSTTIAGADIRFSAGPALTSDVGTITLTPSGQAPRIITVNKFGGIYEN